MSCQLISFCRKPRIAEFVRRAAVMKPALHMMRCAAEAQAGQQALRRNIARVGSRRDAMQLTENEQLLDHRADALGRGFRWVEADAQDAATAARKVAKSPSRISCVTS